MCIHALQSEPSIVWNNAQSMCMSCSSFVGILRFYDLNYFPVNDIKSQSAFLSNHMYSNNGFGLIMKSNLKVSLLMVQWCLSSEQQFRLIPLLNRWKPLVCQWFVFCSVVLDTSAFNRFRAVVLHHGHCGFKNKSRSSLIYSEAL